MQFVVEVWSVDDPMDSWIVEVDALVIVVGSSNRVEECCW